MKNSKSFDEVADRLTSLSPMEGLKWLGQRFGSGARFSTSLGLEDQVITAMIALQARDIEIFTLDTGRLFQETYDVLELTRARYNYPIKAYAPDTAAVEALITAKGPNSFFESVDNRKQCCHIRKVEPLRRALDGASVWITGVRAEQSINRTGMKLVEWDEGHQVVKYNPLLGWVHADVMLFIDIHSVPINTLHRKGYPSIGCAPCTRAVAAGEDPRAGRWWWESSARECGLHESKSPRQ